MSLASIEYRHPGSDRLTVVAGRTFHILPVRYVDKLHGHRTNVIRYPAPNTLGLSTL